MRTYWMLFLILFSSFLFQSSFACECTGPAKLKPTIKESTKIFLGKVLSIAVDPQDPSFFWVNFSVQKSWKGVATKRTRIKVASAESCGYAFSKGKAYLVFSSHQTPYTSACGWTKPAEAATNTVKILGRPRVHY